MIKITHSKLRLLFAFLLLVFVGNNWVSAQGRVQITVSQVEVTQNVDCDGVFLGDSDFVWEVKVDDGVGNSNNNPSVPNLVGALGGNSNHFYQNGNNGPYLGTPASPNGIDFNPPTGLIFDQEYACTPLPSSITVEWEGYENDSPTNYTAGAGVADARTGTQTINLPIPASGATTSSTFSAFGTAATGSCNGTQEYVITFTITMIPTANIAAEDDICNALPIPVTNTVQRYAWCSNSITIDVDEPRRGSVDPNGSAWFYFTAPASGNVEIETDHGVTDFGTELTLYHAADGIGCVQGINNWVSFAGINPIKSKYDYLSYQGFSDDDVVVINPNAKATARFEGTGVNPTNDGHALIPGEIYYIQLTTDEPNQSGYIGISIEETGGTPYRGIDIPCLGEDISAAAIGTTVVTEDNGQPESAQLQTNRVSDDEVGSPYNGTDAREFRAYDYVPANSNNLQGGFWVKFVAPASGRIYFESDLDNAVFNETENSVLYAPDPRFGAGTPADLFCSNLVQIAEEEGGTGIGGATKTAIIQQQCLEPGYTYYGLIDPQSASTANDAEVWIYDPSVDDPILNAPSNDILCLAIANNLFEVPVKPANQVIPFQAVAGDNTGACIERLAGEPFSDTRDTSRADQTVWHYFVAPPSGVVEMSIRAYIGMDVLNWSVYELLNGTDCYGGLQPATFTDDGTQATPTVLPITSGRTDFSGDQVGLCCLVPGRTYAVQIDGGSPGDQGQYIIEYIHEIEVYAGDAEYYTNSGDTFDYTIPDTSYVCFGDTLFPTVGVDALGNTTSVFPSCIGLGFMVHDSLNIPDSIVNGNFTFLDTVYQQSLYWVNDGSNVFGQNALHYVSPLADEMATWGQLVCPSASAENGVPFIFLGEILLATTYNQSNCIIDFTPTGGMPAFNGTNFNYVVADAAGDTVAQGAIANGFTQQFAITIAGPYTISVTDSVGCGTEVTINAAPCLDPCINNPVILQPDPVDSTVYTCFPGGDSALVTIQMTGGEPTLTAGSPYTSVVSGSTAPSANNTYTTNSTGASTPFSFTVRDGDSWQIAVLDVNGCSDTLSGTFDYNLMNCPDYCTLNPIVASYNYNCNTNGTALVEITLNGGQPTIDGSNYSVNISGSTVFGQNYQNAQLAGTIGAASNFSFVVDDTDNWNVIISDINGCADTINDNFTFDTSNCPLCMMMPVQILPDPADSTVYTCFPDGSALVTLYLTGGDAFINGTNFDVTVSGSSVAAQNGTTSRALGIFQFTVNNTDNWQVVALDANGCADTVGGIFDYNLTNCPDFCQQQPLAVGPTSYICNGDGTASVDVMISGGQPSFDGSNYSIDVTGSSNGGNVTGATLAGVIGDTVIYTFTVDNGDSWSIDVNDNQNCMDNISGTFTFDINNCPNLCALVNLQVDTTDYECFANKTALITIGISGGQPSFDGSDYLVTIIGSNAGGSGYQIPVAGTIGDTTDYTFRVDDGDNWLAVITDGNCTDSIRGSFVWTATTCGSICSDPSYVGVAINGNTGQFTYDCDSAGNAVLAVQLTGGLPQITSGRDDYIAEVTINGNLATYLVNSNGLAGNLNVDLENGDVWSISIYDALRCDTATVGGTFTAVQAVATTTATYDLLIGQFADLDGSNSTGNISSYNWTPPTYVTDPTAALTTVQPLNATTYLLTVSDTLGCSDTASVFVPVGSCVPSAAGFTPNNDGVNDFWEIPCLLLFDNTVEVYNRWGQKVFEAQNYDGTWDGKNLSQDLPDATYYYIIEVQYPNLTNPKVLKGTVTIIR